MSVEADQVGIDVVQQRPARLEAEGHGQAAAEGLHEAAALVILPEAAHVGHEPALPPAHLSGGRTCAGAAAAVVIAASIRAARARRDRQAALM